MEKINFYEVLGISKTATQDEIRNAYRSMSKTLHPDVGGNAALFRLVNEAYETLSDPRKRSAYDTESAEGGQGFTEDIPYVRFEDAYRQWRQNKMRTSCPPIDSWNSGGVRRLVRSSALIVWIDDPMSPDVLGQARGDAFCGMCGFVASSVKLTSKDPLAFRRERYGSPIGGNFTNGDVFGECGKCQAQLANSQFIHHKYPRALDEPISIDQGDYLLLARNYLLSLIHI